jgi:hypothetical protein
MWQFPTIYYGASVCALFSGNFPLSTLGKCPRSTVGQASSLYCGASGRDLLFGSGVSLLSTNVRSILVHVAAL